MRYRIFAEQKKTDESGCYQTYGIQGLDAKQQTVVQISDISTDREQVELLALRCTRGELAFEHLRDVVEDFL